MTDLTTMTDDEIEREIEERVREQERRHVLALRAIRNQRSMFLPNRLYVAAR